MPEGLGERPGHEEMSLISEQSKPTAAADLASSQEDALREEQPRFAAMSHSSPPPADGHRRPVEIQRPDRQATEEPIQRATSAPTSNAAPIQLKPSTSRASLNRKVARQARDLKKLERKVDTLDARVRKVSRAGGSARKAGAGKPSADEESASGGSARDGKAPTLHDRMRSSLQEAAVNKMGEQRSWLGMLAMHGALSAHEKWSGGKKGAEKADSPSKPASAPRKEKEDSSEEDEE